MASARIIESSVRDVIPSQKNIEPELTSLTSLYYSKSKKSLGNLPQSEEHERAHICAFIAVNKLRVKLLLPNPSTERIALPPKKFVKLRQQMESLLFNISISPRKQKSPRKSTGSIISPRNSHRKSPAITVLTPTAQTHQNVPPARLVKKNATPESKEDKKKVPSKRVLDEDEVGYGDLSGYLEHQKAAPSIPGSTRKGVANLLDNFRSLSPPVSSLNATPTKKKLKTSSVLSSKKNPVVDQENVINISSSEPSPVKGRTFRKQNNDLSVKEESLSSITTPAKHRAGDIISANKKSVNRTAGHRYSPRKSSPLKSLAVADASNNLIAELQNSKKVSSSDIVNICNLLKLPAFVAHKLLATFQTYKSKIKEEWGFICGLIIVVYFRMFDKQLNSKLGLRGKFYQKLLKWQRGGLTIDGIKHWNSLTEGMVVESEEWIKNLELRYGQSGEDDFSKIHFLYSTGNMINPEADYLHSNFCAKYDKWIHKVKAEMLALK